MNTTKGSFLPESFAWSQATVCCTALRLFTESMTAIRMWSALAWGSVFSIDRNCLRDWKNQNIEMIMTFVCPAFRKF